MNPPIPSHQLLRGTQLQHNWKLYTLANVLLALSQRSRCQSRGPIFLQCQCRTFSQTPGRLRKNDRETIDPSELKNLSEKTESAIPNLKTGKLAPSIFDEISPKAEGKDDAPRPRPKRLNAAQPSSSLIRNRDWQRLKPSIKDPTPKARIRWLRKKVIQDVKGRHRLTRGEKILKTERSHLVKSPFIKTSIKKLGPLARQIAGKPVDEALLQMRFSKKKAARDVIKHLKYARDQAIVAKGMGLGKDIAPGVERPQAKEDTEKGAEEKITVLDRYGKKRTINDRSAMYIDQAWVGRGTYGEGSDFRARGRVNRLRLPWTSEFLGILLFAVC